MISRYTHYMSDDVINEEKLNEIINGFERILKRSYGYTRKVCNGILPDIMDLVRVELDYIDEDASANKKKESDESAKEADDCCKNCAPLLFFVLLSATRIKEVPQNLLY